MNATSPKRLGLVCVWEKDESATWSGTPYGIRRGLRERFDVVSIDPGLPMAARAAMRLAWMRRRDGRWVSRWKWSRTAETVVGRSAMRQVSRSGVPVALQLGDFAAFGIPFFLYQDLSFDVLDELYPTLCRYFWIDRDTIRRRRDRQREIYDRAAGVFAMSGWLARTLVDWSGIPAEKVHQVDAGINAMPSESDQPAQRAHRQKLLFVGRDFHRKAGDLVVAATAILRKEIDPSITLTVVGPSSWPLGGAIPEAVRFLGSLPVADVQQLYKTHDVLVLPSRFEPFGIAFAEALAHGLPCVGRDAFAMPELVVPGVNGALIDGDNVDELVEAIARVIGDEQIYERCRDGRRAIEERYSWSTVASRMSPWITDASRRNPTSAV